MGIRVLFLYPNTYGINMLPPAIALFTAILRERGHEISIFDTTYYPLNYGVDSDGTKMKNLNVLPFDMKSRGITAHTTNWRDDLKIRLSEFSPDLIAMSCTEDMWELGVEMMDMCDSYIERTKTPMITGGVFSTFAPYIAIRHPLVKMVCVGEGENALIDLCDRIAHGKSYDDVTNLWVKLPDGTIKRNPISNPVDINVQPMIDVSLFEEARLYRPMAGKVYKMLPVETIRGCPYQCAYCNSPSQVAFYKEATSSNFVRKKRTDLIERELKFFTQTLGLEYVYFWADTFLAQSNKEFDEFCEMYEAYKLPFWIQTRPETLTDYKVKRLAQVGLHRISFGVEHGNEEFRAKHLMRNYKNDDLIGWLKIPRKYDIPFSVNNITGFPYETRDLAMDTVELNRHILADNQNIYSFVPFHGTPLRRVTDKLGLTNPDQITKSAVARAQLHMPQYSDDEIEGLKRCFVLYVKFPKNRWNDIRRAEANTPEGDRIFDELRAEYMEKYFVKPAPDGRGGYRNTADLEYGIDTDDEFGNAFS